MNRQTIINSIKEDSVNALDKLMDHYLDKGAYELMDKSLKEVKETYPHHRYYMMELVKESDLYEGNKDKQKYKCDGFLGGW